LNVNNTGLMLLAFMPEFGYCKIGLGLYLPIIFPILTPNDFFYSKRWYNHNEWDFMGFSDSLHDLAIKIIYVRYGHKGDPLYARIGSLPSVTLGNGFIMNNYSNMLDFPTVRRIGLEFAYVYNHLAGIELFSSDITRNKLLAYRVAIYIDAGVNVQLSELYDGSDAHGALILGGYDAFVAHRAQLSLISDRTLASEGYMPIFSNRIKADSHSNVILRTFDFGDGNGLQLFKVQLREYASIESSHLLYISGNARMGTVSKIIHIGKNSSSRQKAKNILKEQSRGIFDALIKVERSGKYTKAHQNSKSILLNNGAHMVSKPQLEIYIDDLEASHGSTTGQLDEQQLFYLRSRGISKDEAKKMLILAFANELIDAVVDDNIRENIHKSFEKAYYGHTYVACMETCHGCENAITADKG